MYHKKDVIVVSAASEIKFMLRPPWLLDIASAEKFTKQKRRGVVML